jgi:hypothetical protein
VTLSKRSVSASITASASANLWFCNAVLPAQITRSRTGSDQANKVDRPVFRSLFGQLSAIFPWVVPSAIVHVHFHRLCNPVSASLIADTQWDWSIASNFPKGVCICNHVRCRPREAHLISPKDSSEWKLSG